jgi:hypothetical protein
MTFLVLDRTADVGAPETNTSDSLKNSATRIQKWIDAGFVKAAWILQAGGYAYVTSTATTEELNRRLGLTGAENPKALEIIPVVDAAQFLTSYAKRLSRVKANRS